MRHEVARAGEVELVEDALDLREEPVVVVLARHEEHVAERRRRDADERRARRRHERPGRALQHAHASRANGSPGHSAQRVRTAPRAVAVAHARGRRCGGRADSAPSRGHFRARLEA